MRGKNKGKDIRCEMCACHVGAFERENEGKERRISQSLGEKGGEREEDVGKRVERGGMVMYKKWRK